MRVALYVRVSTQEQKKYGHSVNSQIDALQNYAKEHGHTVVGIYNDAGISARKSYMKRPAIIQLMNDCKAGMIDLILFTKLDRWFRSISGYYEVQKILDDSKVPWRAIWEDYQTETSDGVFKVNIMLSIAQAESDRTSERVRAVMDYRRSQGYYNNPKTTTGYKVVKSKIYKDEATQEGVQAFFDEYLLTYSVVSAIRAAREKGVNISTYVARCMLRHDAYAGETNGCKCEPYITLEQQARIRESLKRRHRTAVNPTKPYIFSGIIRCPKCGGAMVGGYMKPRDTVYKYYHCRQHVDQRNCVGYHISEKIVERLALESIAEQLDQYRVEVIAVNNVKEREKELASLNKRLDRLIILFEEGDISRESFKAKRDAIKDRIAEINAVIPTIPKPLPTGWRAVYDALDDEHKKAFWQTSIKQIKPSVDKTTVDISF